MGKNSSKQSGKITPRVKKNANQFAQRKMDFPKPLRKEPYGQNPSQQGAFGLGKEI